MAEPRLVKVGTVIVAGGRIRLDAAKDVAVDASPGEELDVALFYDYEEGSHARERVELVLAAGSSASTLATGSLAIRDTPVVSDDRRGFFSVRIRAPDRGEAEYHADLRASYRIGPWTGGSGTEAPVHARVPVHVRVR